MKKITIFDKYGNTIITENVVYVLFVSDLKLVVTEKRENGLVNNIFQLKDIETFDIE